MSTCREPGCAEPARMSNGYCFDHDPERRVSDVGAPACAAALGRPHPPVWVEDMAGSPRVQAVLAAAQAVADAMATFDDPYGDRSQRAQDRIWALVRRVSAAVAELRKVRP